jgi:hypothetical protein
MARSPEASARLEPVQLNLQGRQPPTRAPIDKSEQEDLEFNMSRQLKLSRKSKVAKKASYLDSDSEDSISPTSKCAATVNITCL